MMKRRNVFRLVYVIGFGRETFDYITLRGFIWNLVCKVISRGISERLHGNIKETLKTFERITNLICRIHRKQSTSKTLNNLGIHLFPLKNHFHALEHDDATRKTIPYRFILLWMHKFNRNNLSHPLFTFSFIFLFIHNFSTNFSRNNIKYHKYGVGGSLEMKKKESCHAMHCTLSHSRYPWRVS